MAETPNPKSNFTSSLGCSLLFLFPFAACGIFMIGLIGWTLIQWATISHWEEGTATILEVKVRYGEDSDSMGVKARYAYEWEGEIFQNDRVSLYGGTDNVGSFQKRIYKELKQSHKRKAPVPCYINPQKPSEAILYRDLRWEMIVFYSVFAEVFGGIGVCGIVLMLVYRESIKDDDILKAKYPKEPWKWKRDWMEGNIPSSGSTTFPGGAIFVASYWNIVGLPMWILAPLEIFKGNYWGLVGFIIPVIGVLLIIWATRVKIRRSKYGLTTLRLLDTPVVIGGRLNGAILMEKPFYPENGFECTLQCEERISRDKGSDTQILYEDSEVIGYEAAIDVEGHLAVPVSFAIPLECVSTDMEGSRTVAWELSVEASVPGVDYTEEFIVPVFKTEQGTAELQVQDSSTAWEKIKDPDAPLKLAGIRIEQDGFGKLNVTTQMGRNFGLALWLGIFSVIWVVAVFFLYQKYDSSWLIILGAMGAMSFYWSLGIFFQSSDIEVNEHSLEFRNGWFFRRRIQRIPLQDISKFRYRQSMSSGHKTYNHIYVKTHKGKSKIIMKYVKGQTSCRRLISILEEAVRR